MKRITIGWAAMICSFVIGVVAVSVWFSIPLETPKPVVVTENLHITPIAELPEKNRFSKVNFDSKTICNRVSEIEFLSKGLGLSMVEWERLYGVRRSSEDERTAVEYCDGKYVTLHWYANPDSNRTREWKYSDADYNTKYIRLNWGKQRTVSLDAARSEAKDLIPTDSVLISTTNEDKKIVESYSSEWLKTRFFPLYGDNDCVSPWGGEPGTFKVTYHLRSNRVHSMVMDIGEPHETNVEECKGK